MAGADRKKPVSAAPSGDKAPARAAAGAGERRIPVFAKHFPSDPALDRLVDLFEQGNYAAVRKDAPALLASTKDGEVRAAVNELLKRMSPDPLSIGLVVLATLLLVSLASWYWTHPHEAAPPPTPQSVPAPGPVSS